MINSIPANKYCSKIFDGTHDTPQQVPIGMPLVTSKNILGGRLNLQGAYNISEKDYVSVQKRSAVSQWDVLFSMIGSVGEVYLEKSKDIPYAIKNVGVFSCDDEYKAKWLYYYLQSPASKTFINNYLAGAVQKFLSLGILRDYPVYPFDETKVNAVDILSLIDSKIELNNQINTEFEAMAKTIYNYWFVQFDFPNANNRPYKTSGGKMIWSKKLKIDIPEGWKVKKINEVILTDKGGDWGKEQSQGAYSLKVKCIRGADINGLNGIGNCDLPIRFINSKNINRLLGPNDLIIEISGGSPIQSTGRLTFITESVLNRLSSSLICSNFCRAIVLKNKKMLFNLSHYWNTLYEHGVFFNHEGKTTGIRNLLFESFVNSNYIVVPTESILNHFYDYMTLLNNKKQILLSENQELAQLRDWLLPILMNGQVKVN